MFELNLYTQIALTTLLAVLGIWGSILVIRWLVRVMRVEADQRQTLRLVNRGNCASQYHLSVNAAAPNLKFSFNVEGIPLAPVYEEIEEEVVEEETVLQTGQKPAASAAAPATDTNAQAAQKTEKLNTGDALKKGQDASAKAGVLANLLGVIGSVLPGSLGKSVKGAAGGARKAQATSAKAIQAPKSAQRKMDAAKKSGSRLGVNAEAPQDTGVAKPKPRGGHPQNKRDQAEFSRATRNIVKKIKKTVEKVGVVQTVDLDPGDVLFVTLEISKQGKRYPAGSFGYSLESQPVPLNRRFGDVPAAVKKGQVHFAPIPRWRYWMPSISVSVYLILLALLAYYAVLYIWA